MAAPAFHHTPAHPPTAVVHAPRSSSVPAPRGPGRTPAASCIMHPPSGWLSSPRPHPNTLLTPPDPLPPPLPNQVLPSHSSSNTWDAPPCPAPDAAVEGHQPHPKVPLGCSQYGMCTPMPTPTTRPTALLMPLPAPHPRPPDPAPRPSRSKPLPPPCHHPVVCVAAKQSPTPPGRPPSCPPRAAARAQALPWLNPPPWCPLVTHGGGHATPVTHTAPHVGCCPSAPPAGPGPEPSPQCPTPTTP